jgi:hypothetical protein
MTPEPKLTPREALVVKALLAHQLGEAAAKVAGVSLRTLRRYTARPHVREALRRGALDRMRATTAGLARHCEAAADALGQMAAGTLPATVARTRAAIAVVELAIRAVEAEDRRKPAGIATIEVIETDTAVDEKLRRMLAAVRRPEIGGFVARAPSPHAGGTSPAALSEPTTDTPGGDADFLHGES